MVGAQRLDGAKDSGLLRIEPFVEVLFRDIRIFAVFEGPEGVNGRISLFLMAE